MAWVIKVKEDMNEAQIKLLRLIMEECSVDPDALKMTPAPAGAGAGAYTHITVTFKWSWLAEELKAGLEKRARCTCELKEIRG